MIYEEWAAISLCLEAMLFLRQYFSNFAAIKDLKIGKNEQNPRKMKIDLRRFGCRLFRVSFN